MKHHPQQFDFPLVGSFNLAGETATDVARVIREKQQSEADKAAAEDNQTGLTFDGEASFTDERH